MVELPCQHVHDADASHLWSYIWRGITSQYPAIQDVQMDISRSSSVREWLDACIATLRAKGWSARAAADLCFTVWRRAWEALCMIREHIAGPEWRLDGLSGCRTLRSILADAGPSSSGGGSSSQREDPAAPALPHSMWVPPDLDANVF